MTPQEKALKDLQQALKEVDARRTAADLSDDQRQLLELSAVALRNAERLAIAALQKKILKDMEAATAQVNALAKQIRARVTKMSKVPKALDKIETVVREVVRVLGAVGKW